MHVSAVVYREESHSSYLVEDFAWYWAVFFYANALNFILF